MKRSRTILLVEDNEDDIALTERAFARSQVRHELVVARDGAEALEYLLGDARPGEKVVPEVVLLDLKLPGLDGLEVLRRMRSDPRTRRVPVVILTSSVEEQDRAASYDLGANSFVRKPIDFAHFLLAARQLESYWLELNVPAPLPR